MRQDRTQANSLAPTAQNLSRILIASYFIAVSLNLIAGTTGSALALWFVPAEHADLVSAIVVFSLAFLVLIGVWLRPAALLLAMVMFWSSFITFMNPETRANVDGFWRDLALIGALFLTYAHSSRRAARMRSVLRRKLPVRKLKATGKQTARRVTAIVSATARPVIDADAVPKVQFTSQRRIAQEVPADVEDVAAADDGNIFTNVYPLKATA